MQGAQIQAWMQHAGVTRAELAARSGVRVTDVSVILCHVAQLQRGLLESGCPLYLLLPEVFADALCPAEGELEVEPEGCGTGATVDGDALFLQPEHAAMTPLR